MSVKKIILKIHLWLGLSSGLVILFLGLTGCILAFQREFENALQDYRYVKAQQKEFLAPSVLKDIGAKQLPDKHLHAVLYKGKSDAAEVIFYQFEPVEYYYIVYLDPYDGTVLKVKNMNKDFFRQVIMGHFYLWLPPHIGQPIVTWATAIFLVMMISGLILWWPRNKSARKQRFLIRWNVRWRRRNYDLHNVLGFYMTWVAIVIAITGMIFGFQWFASGIQKLGGGDKSLVYTEPASDTTLLNAAIASSSIPAMDRVWAMMKKEYPDAEVLEVHVPETAASPIAANANPDAATYYKTDYRYFDQYSMKELSVDHIYGRYAEMEAGDKLIRMNYDIHTGAILGIAGKILMFFASLIAASLPVTGFIIWWGRRKKRRESGERGARSEVENDVKVEVEKEVVMVERY